MTVRLPETTQTLQAELLEQMLAFSEGSLPALERGSFVSKEIGGRRYWYLQRLAAGVKRQIYLGAESDELLERIRSSESDREEQQSMLQRFRELSAMAVAGGATRLPATVSAVLETLADLGMFRFGGMLIGTHAFAAYGGMLGVCFEGANVRTEDIDLAQSRITVAVDQDPAIDLLDSLREIDQRFFAVPSLDPRKPSTSFAVRGRDLRVDFLTTGRRGEASPVMLPLFGIAAQPLPNLDYLTRNGQPAVLHGRSPILVSVPAPAHFSLHKLWTSLQRAPAFQTKSRKDLAQAANLLEVLLRDRPSDVSAAWRDARRHRMIGDIRKAATKLGTLGADLLDVAANQ